jgi:predicted nucleic acid-binding protein
MVEQRRLWGIGLGWIDLHLMAAARIAGCRLWTFDKRLAKAADEMGIGYSGWLN